MIILEGLTNELSPIRKVATRFLNANHTSIETERVCRISKRPKIGTEAYAISVFHGITDEDISNYEKIHKFKINEHYRKFLSKLNGSFIFEMSLFGIPQTMNINPPGLDRSTINPHDLSIANLFWKTEYINVESFFHFGGGPWTDDENIGYFIDQNGTILSILENGSCLNSWNSFELFLKDEIERAESKYSDYENFMSELKK